VRRHRPDVPSSYSELCTSITAAVVIIDDIGAAGERLDFDYIAGTPGTQR
jgi:hypothetical protein